MASFLSLAARRHFSTTARRAAAGAGAGGHGSPELWKNLSIFVAFPCVLLTAINAYVNEREHLSHPREEFVAWDHLRIRNKAFPWRNGDRSLFHHPHYNAVKDGYEDEMGGDEEEEEDDE